MDDILTRLIGFSDTRSTTRLYRALPDGVFSVSSVAGNYLPLRQGVLTPLKLFAPPEHRPHWSVKEFLHIH